MAWHVFTKRTETGTYVSPAIPPLADRPPARTKQLPRKGSDA